MVFTIDIHSISARWWRSGIAPPRSSWSPHTPPRWTSGAAAASSPRSSPGSRSSPATTTRTSSPGSSSTSAPRHTRQGAIFCFNRKHVEILISRSQEWPEKSPVLRRNFTFFPPRPLRDILDQTNFDPEAEDLIQKMLKFDPGTRLTAQSALAHAFFTDCGPSPHDSSTSSSDTSRNTTSGVSDMSDSSINTSATSEANSSTLENSVWPLELACSVIQEHREKTKNSIRKQKKKVLWPKENFQESQISKQLKLTTQSKLYLHCLNKYLRTN